MALERVQKILARAGIASRRQAETLIREGSVAVNGKIIKLGDRADISKDSIKVGGKLLRTQEAHVYIAFYKPRGVICSLSDPSNRPTLTDYLHKIKQRVYPVGRLDYNSEGLLLLTNDGDLAEKIQKNDELSRVYSVKVKGHPTPEDIARLARGSRKPGIPFKPNEVSLAQELQSKAKILIKITGPKTPDLKVYFEQKRFLVESVSRLQIGHLKLKEMKPGQYRFLKKTQVEALIESS